MTELSSMCEIDLTLYYRRSNILAIWREKYGKKR